MGIASKLPSPIRSAIIGARAEGLIFGFGYVPIRSPPAGPYGIANLAVSAVSANLAPMEYGTASNGVLSRLAVSVPAVTDSSYHN